ncbi:MAG TPA: hypothetical protein ENN03_04430 [bacterium]|nr:hypothetical protein [bacterium]
MRIDIYRHPHLENELKADNAHIEQILETVAAGTDTHDLVVGLYLLPETRLNRGTAYVQKWLFPSDYHAVRGRWKFNQAWPVPKDLPARFKLIRLRIDTSPSLYPRTETDIYGWTFQYPEAADHLALLFAHELHHYRRYHSGLHEREGEHSANRWALKHVCELGFRPEGRRNAASLIRKPLRKKHRIVDPYSRFRILKSGENVRIMQDPRNRYNGQQASVLKPVRAGSRRMVIQTRDGKAWRWPMAWLDIEKNR